MQGIAGGPAIAKEIFKSCWLLALFLVLMAVGASTSWSATGNRGGGGRDRNRVGGQGQGRGQGGRREDVGRSVREDQGEEDSEEGGDEGEEEGNDEEEIMVDGTKFGRAASSIFYGDYKKKPMCGKPKLGVVTFINKKNYYSIKEAHYKKTLKAIVRTRWDIDTTKQKGRAQETFLNECIEEFKEFY